MKPIKVPIFVGLREKLQLASLALCRFPSTCFKGGRTSGGGCRQGRGGRARGAGEYFPAGGFSGFGATGVRAVSLLGYRSGVMGRVQGHGGWPGGVDFTGYAGHDILFETLRRCAVDGVECTGQTPHPTSKKIR